MNGITISDRQLGLIGVGSGAGGLAGFANFGFSKGPAIVREATTTGLTHATSAKYGMQLLGSMAKGLTAGVALASVALLTLGATQR